MSHRRHLLSWLAPNVALMASFLLAWLAPEIPGAATAEDCRSIMLLEGLSILAVALVGGYRETALTFFPPAVAGCMLWLFANGTAGLSWAWVGFLWYIVQAFIDGVRAHRGDFGLARENPDHPHRRYDRLVFLYVGTAAALPIARLLGSSACWAIWGSVYFASSTAVEHVLRDWFDRIPRSVLRHIKRRLRDPEIESQIGICLDCVYVQPAIPAKPQRMIRCCLSVTDSTFPEYPATPVHTCAGFRRSPEAER